MSSPMLNAEKCWWIPETRRLETRRYASLRARTPRSRLSAWVLRASSIRRSASARFSCTMTEF